MFHWIHKSTKFELDSIIHEAQKQIDEEKFQLAVETKKEELRNKKPVSIWHRLIPFTIIIQRRNYGR